MFRRTIFALLLAAPSAAVMGQGQEMGDWGVAQMPNGCMVEAVSPQGTMISVWGFAGQPKLAFLLQNKGWNALQDGRSYKLSLDFVGTPTAMPVDATARQYAGVRLPGPTPDAPTLSTLQSGAVAVGGTLSVAGHLGVGTAAPENAENW